MEMENRNLEELMRELIIEFDDEKGFYESIYERCYAIVAASFKYEVDEYCKVVIFGNEYRLNTQELYDYDRYVAVEAWRDYVSRALEDFRNWRAEQGIDDDIEDFSNEFQKWLIEDIAARGLNLFDLFGREEEVNVIHAFVTQSPRDVKAGNLRYDAYCKRIFSYDYKIGYWIFAPNKTPYAVIRAHDAPSKTTAKHMTTLNIRSGCIRSMTLPILTPKLFDKLPDCKGEQGWDFTYVTLYRAYAAKAARTKQRVYFEGWKRQMATIVENLDKIATAFGWSYDRSIYTPENVLADNPKLLEQFALRDMGVWG